MTRFEINSPRRGPVTYTLEAEHLSVVHAGRKRFEVRVPYWNISPTYSKQTRPREKTALAVAKIAVWSVVPLICAGIALEMWGFWIPAILFGIPCFVWGRRIGRPEVHRIIFNEDDGGGWAFDIEFTAQDENRVLEFVAVIEAKVRAFAGRRRDERRRADGQDDEDEAAEI